MKNKWSSGLSGRACGKKADITGQNGFCDIMRQAVISGHKWSGRRFPCLSFVRFVVVCMIRDCSFVPFVERVFFRAIGVTCSEHCSEPVEGFMVPASVFRPSSLFVQFAFFPFNPTRQGLFHPCQSSPLEKGDQWDFALLRKRQNNANLCSEVLCLT